MQKNIKLSYESVEILSKYFNEKDKNEKNGYTLSKIISDLQKIGISIPDQKFIENSCSLKQYLELIEIIIKREENWAEKELEIVHKITTLK